MAPHEHKTKSGLVPIEREHEDIFIDCHTDRGDAKARVELSHRAKGAERIMADDIIRITELFRMVRSKGWTANGC